MVSRVAAFVIWAAVAASSVFWALRFSAKPIAAPEFATVVSAAGSFQGDLRRVFGQDAPPPQASVDAVPPAQVDARFRLIGVVAPRPANANGEGLALIATDGKPPKAYRVGTSVDGELMLLAVHARGASLGPRGQPPQLALELPALPPPSTGTLQGSTQVSPVPRAQIAPQPRQAPQPAVVPVPPSPANPDTDESESQPEPGNRPAYTPPAGAERPPTVQGRPPTVGGRPPT